MITTILILIACFFSSLVIHPKRISLDASYADDEAKGFITPEQYGSWDKKEVSALSPYGYAMAATWIPVAASKKTVIFLHGITWTRYGSCKYASIFHALGYNALIIDLRYHGATGGKNCTFGFYEKNDVTAWVDWVEREIGDGAVIGTHGESMGAAVALQHAAIDRRVSFVVADCPFSKLDDLLAWRLRHGMHLPRFPLLPLSDIVTSIRTGGMRYKNVSPIAGIAKISSPVLFVHGEDDDYIPADMSRAMHQARISAGLKSSIRLVPGATHAKSYETDPEGYRTSITEFLGSS